MGMNIPSLVGGTVKQVFVNNKTAGNGVVVQGADGREYRYIHMKNPPKLKVGQRVEAGMSLGQIGNTGRSTGPHLDLKIVENGKNIDPMKVIRALSASAPVTNNDSRSAVNSGKIAHMSSKGSSYTNTYKTKKEALKSPGYQTYKTQLARAVQAGDVPDSWVVALTELIGRESNWNAGVKNPNSTAKGYGQFLKSTVQQYEKKMGISYSTPYNQIVMTAQYVKDRYGSPEKALAFWDKNKWY